MSKLDVSKCYSPKELGMGLNTQGTDSVIPFVIKPVLPEQPKPPTGAGNDKEENSVSVYVRVRPLLEEETKSGVGMMPGMITTSSDPGDTSATALKTDKVSIGGFTGVLGTEVDNETMFKRCFKSRLDSVLAGGTASLFCYGYTGSGKSHTVLGYDGEKGLYHLAAGDLLARMEEKYPGEDLFLLATACEIYGEQVYDLMGEEKLPATLRTDADGNLCVFGPAVRSELSELVEEFKTQSDSSLGSAAHATIVTRTRGLRCGLIRSVQDLDAFSTSALQLRVVGSSTEHSQSSRSHAVLRMEVMNMETYMAREAVEDAKVLLAPLLSGIDNHYMECFNKLLGKWDTENNTLSLKQYEGGQEEWDKVFASLVPKKKQLNEAIPVVMEKIKKAYQQLECVKNHEAVGGALVLVDLAGADYDKRDVGTLTTAQEKKESTDINKSLLALKECFRYIAGSKGAGGHGPFRGSKLTRLLEDSLLPKAHSTRKNKSCASVMVVNVSPADHIAKRTLNVLRYGQIFADGSKKTTERNTKPKLVKKKM
jgi:hypothetical protein